MFNLLRHELQSRIGAIIGWGIGLGLFGAMYISLFPSVEEQMAALADLSIYQAMGIEMSTFEGYIGSTAVLFIPIILGIYAILTSTGTLAGEEDAGTLEMVLAMPLPRWQIVTVKAIAIGIATFLILVISGVVDALVLNLIKQSVEVNVTAERLFVAVLNGWPITMAFAMMGLFLGAYLPSRRIAALGVTVILIASYFGANIAGMLESLEVLKPFSLFSYFDSSSQVFIEGVWYRDVLFLIAVAAGFFVLAVLAFQRRNVTVGAWPWQRATVEG